MATFTINSAAVAAVIDIIMSTKSVSSTWQANTVTNSGPTLTWDITGDYVGNQVDDQPTFDLSTNAGTAIVDVFDTEDVTEFNVEGLDIDSIDVSDNINLTNLNVGDNDLSSLDVSDNVNLFVLNCYINSLTTLDISNNLDLFALSCFENNITTLNLSVNLDLSILYCSNNSLSTLDISNNINLTELECTSNSLTNLDISNNPLLTIVRCEDNFLTSTNIDNILIQLDTNGLSNGTVIIPSGRTAASDTARTNLLGKNWTVTEI